MDRRSDDPQVRAASPTTAEVTVVSANTYHALGLHRLGLKVLEDQLRLAAAFYAGQTTQLAEEISMAVSFVHGIQLEVTLQTFGIPMSATRLRDAFESHVRRASS